jgi:hypothetical protein
VLPLPIHECWEFVFGNQGRDAVEASRMVAALEDYAMRPDGTPQYTMVMKVGRLTLKSVSDYTVFDPPHRTVNTIRGGPFGGTFFVDFEPADGGTRVSERWELQPQGRVVALMKPVLEPVLRYSLHRDLDAWAVAAGHR